MMRGSLTPQGEKATQCLIQKVARTIHHIPITPILNIQDYSCIFNSKEKKSRGSQPNNQANGGPPIERFFTSQNRNTIRKSSFAPSNVYLLPLTLCETIFSRRNTTYRYLNVKTTVAHNSLPNPPHVFPKQEVRNGLCVSTRGFV